MSITISLDLPIDPATGKRANLSRIIAGAADVYVPAFYLPESLTYIGWPAPTIAHTGIDVDFQFFGYDWLNRDITWSLVSPPEGASISNIGRLTWVPSSEGVQSITVRMTVGGQNYDKTFSCDVNNSRCLFVATTGNDTIATGAIDAPFLTLEKAGETITNGVGSAIYIRGGDYVTVDKNWFSEPVGTGYRIIASSAFSENDPLIIRNYPGEAVKYTFTGTSSGFNIGSRVIAHGLELEGGNVGERACISTEPNCYLAWINAHDYQSSYTENCTGIKAKGGTLINYCTSYNNYDRANPTRHNNSNYLFYGTSGEGACCVINSISAGYSGIGFKIKHAGSESNIHIHRCIAYGTLNGWGGADNGSSVRHSLFYKDSTLGDSTSGSYVFGFGATDTETAGQNNLSIGMLCDQNKVISDATGAVGLFQSNHVGIAPSENPVRYLNNVVQLARSTNGAVFETYLDSTIPVDWQAIFEDNEFISPSSTAPVRMGSGTGGLYAIDRLNEFGDGNTHSTSRKDVTLTAANSTWLYDESAQTLYRDGVAVSGALA